MEAVSVRGWPDPPDRIANGCGDDPIANVHVSRVGYRTTVGVFLVAIVYFWFYGHHRLVSTAAEEDFGILEYAEKNLK